MRQKLVCGFIVGAVAALALPVLAQQAPVSLPLATVENEPLLVAADLRDSTDLSGEWHWSIDPYRSGIAGFHGEMPDKGQQRWLDVDVRKEMHEDNRTLYEFDMAHAPTVAGYYARKSGEQPK